MPIGEWNTMTIDATNSRNSRFLTVICLSIVIGMFLVGLWPFNFFPRNNVRWLAEGNGLRFDRFGMAYVREPVFVPGGAIDLANPWTVCLEARPLDEPSDALPRLLSVYDIDGRELFLIAQWRSDLVIRTLEEDRDLRLRYRETGVGNFHRDTSRTFAIRCDNTGVAVHADGKSVPSRIRGPLPLLSKYRSPAYLVVGNSPTGGSPWRGDILALSFIGEKPVVLSPLPEGSGAMCRSGPGLVHDLVIPAVFRAPKKGILVPSWKVQELSRSFWSDAAVNVLGFIPLGFAVSVWLRRGNEEKRLSSMAVAILFGAAISFAIELLQAYLPTRDTSLTDLLANILGTSIGTLLVRK